MPALFCVKVNPETSKLVQTLLFEKGYSWPADGNKKEVQYYDSRFIFPWRDYTICHDSVSNCDTPVLTIDQFIHWYYTNEIPPKEIKLNKDYTAKVYTDKVVIGCQTFEKEEIIKFAKMILEDS